MELCSIASGSSGNCIYAGSSDSAVLIDAGISKKRILEGLNSFGQSLEGVDGILVTHEHSDHISGLGVLTRARDIPIYATAGTIDCILLKKSLKLSRSQFVTIKADDDFYVGNLKIHPFGIYHDAAEPVAYKVMQGDKSVAVVTDTGHYDDYIVDSVGRVDSLLLEANHDVRMLEAGPYPYALKRRILGDRGHLSNENSGRLLSRLLHDGIKKIFLGHLSKENNYDRLALETVRLEVDASGCRYKIRDFDLSVAGREKPTEKISF